MLVVFLVQVCIAKVMQFETSRSLHGIGCHKAHGSESGTFLGAFGSYYNLRRPLWQPCLALPFRLPRLMCCMMKNMCVLIRTCDSCLEIHALLLPLPFVDWHIFGHRPLCLQNADPKLELISLQIWTWTLLRD